MNAFYQKHERWVTGLDQAHDALLEAREQEAIRDEIIRDWLLTDTVLFDRMARRWLDDPVNREGFLDQAVEWVKDERQPQYTRAWRKDPLEVSP